jgi:glycosyltransferase involved in cell wall biosynthesis
MPWESRAARANARVLTRSFLEAHPDGTVFVLIVDRLEPGFRRDDEPFTIIEIEELDNIPNLPAFLFQYTQLESNTAAKPFFLDYLLRQPGVDRLVYLDPDVQVFHRFDDLYALLEQNSIVLTPHVTNPIDDGKRPGEREVLLSGAYNLGFIAVRNSETTQRFLDWWKSRCLDRCIVDQRNGLFVDQRWIDLVPGYFGDVHILREPGYNVAYWNLHERRLTGSGECEVNGRPLYFFHFSGIQFDSIDGISRYQNRYELSDLGDAARLFREYRDRIDRCGHGDVASLPYAFGCYEDGSMISSRTRKMYREYGSGRDRFGNPFEVRSSTSFVKWSRRTRFLQRLGLRRRRSSEARHAMWRKSDDAEALSRPAISPARWPAFRTRPGVNLVGYLTAQSGRGEVVRGLASALRSADVPVSTHSLDPDAREDRVEGSSLGGSSDFRYDVNLFCVDADRVAPVFSQLGRGVLRGRRNVGYWLWELSGFPERYRHAFDDFDEIWTPSAQSVEALSAASSVPVRRVPLPVSVPDFIELDRASYGIPGDDFVFLCAFDFLGFWQRKNPVGVVRAFREAFSSEPVRLILKFSNSDFDASGLQQIEREIGDARVTMIDRTLTREGMNELFRACDVYVSLHRAASFGLTVAEAMAMGMPVIATDYSGVVDFLNEGNGWPVRYELRALKQGVGPYSSGSRWAEPDVSHAAEQMRRVYEDAGEREARAERALKEIREQLSPNTVGRIASQRLSELRRGA